MDFLGFLHLIFAMAALAILQGMFFAVLDDLCS
jgi:hypothetical protein